MMRRLFRAAPLLFVAAAASGQAPADSATSKSATARTTTATRECDAKTGKGTQCGWWWGARRDLSTAEPEKEQQLLVPLVAMTKKQETDEERCSKMETWDVTCGFINPGKNYDWQSMQRDELKLQMVMNPEVPKAVEGFQRYSKWAVNQAIAVWKMWQFNMVQNPELHNTASQPLTSFGLKALSAEKERERSTVFDALREQGAFFVWFTRSDCSYCGYTRQLVLDLSRELSLPIYNASLDGACYPGFEKEFCRTGEATTDPARLLKVKIVPDLMLYLPEEKAWVRIATGVVTKDVMRDRVALFFQAAVAATENAINNRGDFTPSVDFKRQIEQTVRYGAAEGVEQVGGDS